MISMLYISKGTEARTLPAKYVGVHSNGWTIIGEIKHKLFINYFEAYKGNKKVWGDFEKMVYATSKQTFYEFKKLFPYVEWDYKDIGIVNSNR